MMSTWQQIWTLVRFELQHSKLHLLLLGAIYLFLIYLSIPTIPSIVEEEFSGGFLNFYLFILLSLAIVLTRPKVYRSEKIGYGFRASHFLVKLQHLPISKNIIILYRMVTYYIIFIPLYISFLAILYIVSPSLQQLMPVGTYIIFSLIWLALNLLALSVQTTSDFGIYSVQYILFIIFILFPAVIVFSIVLSYVLKSSLISLTILLATNYPIRTVVLLIPLTALGIYGCIRRCRQKMKTFDYL